MVMPIRPTQVRLQPVVSVAGSASPGTDPLGLMASSLAHDLNNILQIVSGNLALLAREGVADTSRHRIENSLAALRSGAELTGSVLDYCRQRSAVGTVETAVAAEHIVAMEPLLRDAAGSDIEMVVSVSDGLWPFRSNVHKLQNAMLNLTVNAHDAMGGRGRLAIGARNVSCPRLGERVWLTVADDGPGIPPEIMEKVFAPFYTTKPHGTGLGLAIVAEFARSTGADVVIDSRPGLGTSVTIDFPRCG